MKEIKTIIIDGSSFVIHEPTMRIYDVMGETSPLIVQIEETKKRDLGLTLFRDTARAWLKMRNIPLLSYDRHDICH